MEFSSTLSSPSSTTDEVVSEIMRLHRTLPPRPSIEEVEAAKTLIQNVEREDQSRIETISNSKKTSKQVPEHLFQILKDLQINFLRFQSKQQLHEPLKLLDLENIHLLFDDLIQNASEFLSNPETVSQTPYKPSQYSLTSVNAVKPPVIMLSKDDSYVKKPKTSPFQLRPDFPQILDPSLVKPVHSISVSGVGKEGEGEKLSFMKLASLIEVSAKNGVKEINLQGKLSENIEWIPDSINKLTTLTNLDLSENRLVMLPNSIKGLSSLQKLDLHANRISELPESIGDLFNLIRLDLRGNVVKSLPVSIARLVRLEELDLSSNSLTILSESIGSLVSLVKLNVEMNDIEEIPHTISRCCKLKELRADYNKIKALPEAVGKLESLEVLSVRYNNVRQLPTTMASLTRIREIDVSFNELESVPESLCFATTLVKMNVSNNFADLQSLPRSIGNLEMLEVLDVSNNQIRVLPDSFGMLTQLRVLNLEGNPLVTPPRDVIARGPQAVVQYMADVVAQRDVKSQPVKQKKSWAQICFCSRSNKRKRNSANDATKV